MSDVTRCQKTQVSECINSTVFIITYVLSTGENTRIYISTNIRSFTQAMKIGIHEYKWLHSIRTTTNENTLSSISVHWLDKFELRACVKSTSMRLKVNEIIVIPHHWQTNNHLSPQANEHDWKRLWHMTLEIQVLAWDRHKSVAKLNRLMRLQCPLSW